MEREAMPALEGAVRTETLIRLVAWAYADRATGVLEVEHDGGLSRAYFREGYPVGAHLYTRFLPLGRLLLSMGWIGIDALDRSLQEVARSGRPQGEVLVELGYLTPERLALALRRQHLTNLLALLQVTEGNWRWRAAAGVELPTWTLDVALSPHEVVHGALVRPEAGNQVAAVLASLGRGPLYLAPEFAREGSRFDLPAGERRALARLREPSTLRQAEIRSGLPPARLRALVAALAAFDLVRAGWDAAVPAEEAHASGT